MEFQSDGLYSDETFMNRTNIGESPLKDFTLCLRFNVNYLRTPLTNILSYTTQESPDSIYVRIIRVDKNNIRTPYELKVCRFEKDCNSYVLGMKIQQTWRHICYVFGTQETGMTMELTTQLYLDGKKVDTTKVDIAREDFTPLSNRGALILGQDNDEYLYGGLFDRYQAFSGKVTQVEIWNTTLTPNDIKPLSQCQTVPRLKEHQVVTWADSSSWIVNNVNLMDQPLKDLCLFQPAVFLWPSKNSFVGIKKMCDIIGGRLPVVGSTVGDEVESLHKTQLDIFSHMVPYNVSDVCYNGPDKVEFWLATNRLDTYPDWSNPYDRSQNFDDYNITGGDEYCSYLWGPQAWSNQCVDGWTCGVCHLTEADPDQYVLYLKGLCAGSIKWQYDLQYYVDGLWDGRPHFK